MEKKFFNKKAKRRAKINLKNNSNKRRMFSRRLGGIIGVSVLLENRNLNAVDLSKVKKEII